MKAIVTGANGTVGKPLVAELKAAGHEVVTWDRTSVPIDNYQGMEEWVAAQNADIIYHLAICSKPTGKENEGWLVNYHWPSELAWITRMLGMRFVFTSTVLVWSDKAKGPFSKDSEPDEVVGYGSEKHLAEERVFQQNPLATVVRLGWQIDSKTEGNNMLQFLEEQHNENGFVRASRLWLPSCSFVDDTARGLIQLATMDCGLFLLNQNDDMNFYEIAKALKKKHKAKWEIEATTDFMYDQRMLDGRIRIPKLSERL